MSTPTPSTSFWEKEPAVAVGLVTTLLSLASSLGFALNNQETTTITTAVFGGVSLVAAFCIRFKVSAPASVAKIQSDAQTIVDTANADKANIIAAIGTVYKPARKLIPVAPDPAPAPVVAPEPTPANVLASIEVPGVTADDPLMNVPGTSGAPAGDPGLPAA